MAPNRRIAALDVQTCFAGAPLLPSLTNGIFFRIINTPLIWFADYFLDFIDWICLQFFMQILCTTTKKNAFGHTHLRRHAHNHTATRPSSPQRHLPHGFTSPFFGDFAPSLDDSSQILTIFGSAYFVKG